MTSDGFFKVTSHGILRFFIRFAYFEGYLGQIRLNQLPMIYVKGVRLVNQQSVLYTTRRSHFRILARAVL